MSNKLKAIGMPFRRNGYEKPDASTLPDMPMMQPVAPAIEKPPVEIEDNKKVAEKLATIGKVKVETKKSRKMKGK